MTQSHRISLATSDQQRGITVDLLNRGATIAGIRVHGVGNLPEVDTVLRYESDSDYDADRFYLGSTVGPVANRLDGGRLDLLSGSYHLALNELDRQNLLHGGELGLHQQTFQPSPTRDSHRLVFSLALPHLSDGFPGERLVTVRYELIDPTSLQCDFMASTDRPTVMNLANHAYFNLGGPLEAHELRIFATGHTPTNDRQIPTGVIASLSETTDDGNTLDFHDWRAIRDQALDHNFVLIEGSKLREAASLRLEESDLQLDVLSTQPALQVYTGDGLTSPFTPRDGICLEAQGFPDAPNQPGFPSICIEPGQTYRQRTVYRFGEIADAEGGSQAPV